MSMQVNEKIINKILLKFQAELLQRAKSVGLMKHSSTNGMLKEFLVKSVLEAVLPKDCGIYSGIIFDGKGNESKQIDIIIYDDRVPKFELSKGLGFYPIEGVIATIEVKSNLNKQDIFTALDNCHSVLNLMPILCGDPKIAIGDNWVKPSSALEQRRALFEYNAATYIFSFDSVKIDTCIGHVKDWVDQTENSIKSGIGLLPRAILGNNWIGLLDDCYITLPETQLNQSKTGNAMVYIESENYFSYFISHLLHKVSGRIKASYGVTECYYSINELLPLNRFIEEDQFVKKYLII